MCHLWSDKLLQAEMKVVVYIRPLSGRNDRYKMLPYETIVINYGRNVVMECSKELDYVKLDDGCSISNYILGRLGRLI